MRLTRPLILAAIEQLAALSPTAQFTAVALRRALGSNVSAKNLHAHLYLLRKEGLIRSVCQGMYTFKQGSTAKVTAAPAPHDHDARPASVTHAEQLAEAIAELQRAETNLRAAKARVAELAACVATALKAEV